MEFNMINLLTNGGATKCKLLGIKFLNTDPSWLK